MADVPIAGPDGVVWVDENDLTQDELSLIGQHHNAIGGYRNTRDPAGLGEFQGVVVHSVPLVTDPDRIDELDDDDRLDFERFYEPPT